MPRTRDRLKVALTKYPGLYERSRRPYAVARYRLGRPHEAEYSAFGLFGDRRGVFLDVGANAGMSALSFRIYNKSCPIVSVEPNPFHEGDLRFVGRIAKPFTYKLWAAGDRDGEMTLHVPVYRGVPITAEASLLADQVQMSSSLRRHLGSRMDTDDFEIVARTVPIKPLDCLELDVAFLKLDVQGYEHQALLGLRQTIAGSRPVLLIERPEPDVDALLGEWGYTPHGFVDGALQPGVADSTNTVYLPG
ncbi:MAG TPA: FkbM family methyltransferase [Baekduia sp.]|nr:FkbM family methyltransferase [Baekduia sp.]